MSRPIKFRGRIPKADGTVELFYQENQYLLSFLRRLSSMLIWEKSGKEKEHEAYLEGDLESYLDRWTGLLDKNGKEIYEGDVAEFDTTSDNGFKDKGQVEREAVGYEDGLWTLGLYFNLPFAHRDYKLEVIGNIHQNPELLTPPKSK